MLDLVEQLFGTRDVYSVLNRISKKDAADPKKLRAGYLRAALAYHPDKASSADKETSTQKFQVLTKIYEVLKDGDNRKAFEQTGVWPDDDSMDLDIGSFSRLDESQILDFKKYYQGSDEEIKDVKELYEKHKGNTIKVIDGLFFGSFLKDDFVRVENIVAKLIDQGDLVEIPPSNPKTFEAQKKRKIAQAKKEAAEVEALLASTQQKGKRIVPQQSSESDLAAAILSRRERVGMSFLDNLEKKYSAMEQEAAVKPPRRKKPRKD